MQIATVHATGSINLTVTGGITPYTYVWTASAGGTVPTGQANNQHLTGLLAGTYSVAVTLERECDLQTTNVAVVTDANGYALPTPDCESLHNLLILQPLIHR
jgi:hypothetical protein